MVVIFISDNEFHKDICYMDNKEVANNFLNKVRKICIRYNRNENLILKNREHIWPEIYEFIMKTRCWCVPNFEVKNLISNNSERFNIHYIEK